MRPFGSPEKLEKRRIKAIELFDQGYQPVDIARKLGVERRSVRRWKAAYLNDGFKGILAKPAPGRPCRLNDEAKLKFEALLLKGAEAAGFHTDLWTCARIAKLLRSHFGIRYHVDHIGRLLHSMGWSPQKPQRQAIERDEAEIQRWIKEDWPRIKKKPIA